MLCSLENDIQNLESIKSTTGPENYFIHYLDTLFWIVNEKMQFYIKIYFFYDLPTNRNLSSVILLQELLNVSSITEQLLRECNCFSLPKCDEQRVFERGQRWVTNNAMNLTAIVRISNSIIGTGQCVVCPPIHS